MTEPMTPTTLTGTDIQIIDGILDKHDLPRMSQSDEDFYLAGKCAGRLERIEVARLIEACNGLIGLVQLIASRPDLPTGLDDVMLLSHRMTEAKAAIDAAREQK